MKVWNIRVTDRNGFDSYSFFQEDEPTNQQLEAIRKIYQKSGRYIPVEIKGSFDNQNIPTYEQLLNDLENKYGKVSK
jgi:DNA invertase Pin-like site-specific DNA recombinase